MKVLFVREDSIYKKILGEENCYDIKKDALNYIGGEPVICHPPCRAWGSLYPFAKPRDEEPELAIWAMKKIVQNGGVLEHPKNSMLFKIYHYYMNQNGFILEIDQFHFGHKAKKATKLFISGISKNELPKIPVLNGEPKYVCSSSWAKSGKKELSQKEREQTPKDFALFLIEICKRIEKNKKI